ncbi:transposase, ISSmu2 [Streptococcus acidominimus]|nr:transposase, ISSmu2 [Streptococcus acidominimus]
MKSDQTIIRKNHMGQLYHTTELIGMKDKHITLNKVFQRETYIEVFATLDYHQVKGTKPRKVDRDKLKNYLETHPDAYLTEIASVFGCHPTAIH